MEYFVIINGVQSGPLSKDRLMTAGIQPDSYVWRQGLADWVKADTLPELADIFMGVMIPVLAALAKNTRTVTVKTCRIWNIL